MIAKRDLPLLPTDARTGDPLSPRAQPGYYPGQQALSQQAFWDAATREVVLARLKEPPPLRFFQPAEAALYLAVLDRLVPQDDRDAWHRIPLLPVVDTRLWEGKGDGYRYEDMPPDPEAYRLGAQGIEAGAQAAHGLPFIALSVTAQDALLARLHAGQALEGDGAVWNRLPPGRFFSLLLSDAVTAYYAHPYAWDEVGFGGPAYPRGYLRLEHGDPESWEVDEQRYAWKAPADSLSDVFQDHDSADGPPSSQGQGGTH